tara:strand:+ start:544 stop:801 length:258 start_codon:yes stop_codon:yes gene_type:complete
MFHIDATFEDCRINATSNEGKNYQVTVTDGFTGASKTIESMPALHLSYILQFGLHNDGEPEGFEAMYPLLEPYFVGWPNTLRPIP